MSRIRALVTGAGALLGQGIIRSLERSSLDIEIIAVDPSPLSVGLYWASRWHLVPLAGDPNYIDVFGSVLAEERPDIVFVGTDPELGVLAAHREHLERAYSTTVVVSSPRVVQIADDKYLTYEFMKGAGFAAPESCLPGGEHELADRVGYPLVVKPRIGARAIGVELVRNREELDHAVRGKQGIVIQESAGADNQEYTAGVLYHEGECRASIVMRRDLRDGNTYRAYVDDYPELNRSVRAMANALQPFGPSNFQFRLDSTGRPRVFEINARFSGTTPLRALAGFNEVELVARALLFGEPIRQPAVERMTILRYWDAMVLPPERSPG